MLSLMRLIKGVSTLSKSVYQYIQMSDFNNSAVFFLTLLLHLVVVTPNFLKAI